MAFLDMMKSITSRPGKQDVAAERLSQLERAFAKDDAVKVMGLLSEIRSGGKLDRRVEIRLNLIEGTTLQRQGCYAEASDRLRAVWESGLEDMALQAGMQYMQCLVECQSYREALRVRDRLLELLENDPVRHGQVQVSGASLLVKIGELEQAGQQFAAAARSLKMVRNMPGVEQLLIEVHSGLGDIFLAREDQQGALAEWREALVLSARVLGLQHPQTAAIQAGVGSLEMMTDDLPAARKSLEQALTTYRAIGKSESMEAAIALSNLAFTLLMLEDLPKAEEAAEQATALSKGVNPNFHMEAKDLLRRIQTARTAVR